MSQIKIQYMVYFLFFKLTVGCVEETRFATAPQFPVLKDE
jgi:hypothetical protein